MAKVGIVMGSDSDMPVMSKAADMLEKFGIDYEMTIISAHREPDVFFEYARSAEEKGFKVIIAGAGMAAHHPGHRCRCHAEGEGAGDIPGDLLQIFQGALIGAHTAPHGFGQEPQGQDQQPHGPIEGPDGPEPEEGLPEEGAVKERCPGPHSPHLPTHK